MSFLLVYSYVSFFLSDFLIYIFYFSIIFTLGKGLLIRLFFFSRTTHCFTDYLYFSLCFYFINSSSEKYRLILIGLPSCITSIFPLHVLIFFLCFLCLIFSLLCGKGNFFLVQYILWFSSLLNFECNFFLQVRKIFSMIFGSLGWVYSSSSIPIILNVFIVSQIS